MAGIIRNKEKSKLIHKNEENTKQGKKPKGKTNKRRDFRPSRLVHGLPKVKSTPFLPLLLFGFF